MADPTLGDNCLIRAAYADGSTVRIGFDRNEDAGYVTAFNHGTHVGVQAAIGARKAWTEGPGPSA